MNETKHTPGPWEAVPSQGDNVWDVVVHTETPMSSATGFVGGVFGEANARLIAAAPVLLEACWRTRNFLLCSGQARSHAVEVLEDAIAKAEGTTAKS